MTSTATSTRSGTSATTTKTANKIKASVFATHGFQDDNVRMDEMGMWWDALKAGTSSASCGCCARATTDPFESRRDVWVDTLHRWFDH